MFTGIITGIGRIVSSQALGAPPYYGKRLTIAAPPDYLSDVRIGDSIAINGACMTLTSFDLQRHQFTIEISQESLSKTTGLDIEGEVNLEKALAAGERLGGHMVSGHVDGVGQVSHYAQTGESWTLRLIAPPALAPYLAYKGSIAVNGVSLTINAVHDIQGGCEISINLIAHTAQNTTLGQLKVGHAVNLEVDTIARYVERMLSKTQGSFVALAA